MIGYLIAGGLLYYLYKKGELSTVAKAASDALANLPAVLPSAPSGEVGAGASIRAGSLASSLPSGQPMLSLAASVSGCACNNSGCRCGGTGAQPVAPAPIAPRPIFGIGAGAPVASPMPSGATPVKPSLETFFGAY